MARTKQTARDSTGDIAARVKLQPRNRGLPRRPPQVIDFDQEDAETVVTKRKRKKPCTSPSTTPAKRAKPTAPDVTPDPVPATQDPQKPGPTTESAPPAQDSAPPVKPPPPVVILPVEGPIIVTDFSNSYCYICHNGGACIGCDECARIVCLPHVPQIEAVPEETRNTLHFRCPSCHTRRTQGGKACAPYYQGLYKVARNGQPAAPYLAEWVKVIVYAARPQHIQVDTRPLIILSVRLVSLDEKASPAMFMYNYLVPWFDGAATTSLRYIDIPFDIADVEDANQYQDKWDEVLTSLGQVTNARLMLFVYTHSHNETGDLFYAPKGCSTSIEEWWGALIPPQLKALATTTGNDLTIAMLACGALIRNEKTRRAISEAATKIGAKRMFAFAATHLQAVLTVPFFLNFTQRVFLEGTDLKDDNVGTVLEQSLFLARHTPIWVFSRATLKNAFDVHVYEWTHLTMHPHGEDIGLQCPGCGSLSSRDGKLCKGELIVVSCTTRGCTWSQTFAPPPQGEVKRLTLGKKGRWRKRITTV
ncbi:hypothetical protein LXA43DRAFT_1069112 [Ganoderma leucocontextum]|nr:hypothetical protein LXA43DRAFT_1069112 [Ganoderma leucocontextum]